MAADVILWWHHHQPWYLDPHTGQARLPWVRMHACRGYLDMAAAAEHASADKVKHTFNFVPSLLDQLERYATPGATDLWLDLSTPHPSGMNDDQRRTLQHRMGGGGPRPVQELPRLDELRGKISRNDILSDGELLDLQVLAHLGFCGATLADRKGIVRDLMHKGRGFTQAEKLLLLKETVSVCSELLQRYRALWAAKRIEITSSPYFHPILPLLIDTHSMVDGLPDNPQPPRFHHPEDARVQIKDALDRCEEVFGQRPTGMWPSEGSVSPEAVKLMAEAGITFCGTDEMVLYRSTAAGDARTNHGVPWMDPSGRMAMFFRDHGVSDLIGFTYRNQPPDEAAEHFVGCARKFGEARGGAERAVMTVILDGENPWEHYPNAGRDHLIALQRALGSARDLHVVTPSERLAKARPKSVLKRLHSGSWIDGTFGIWIGHSEDRTGWKVLGDCRRAIERAQQEGAPEATIQAALKKLYPAEGSDWFWWFGEEFQAREADLYDELFREQIKSAYLALGKAPPARLNAPIKEGRAQPTGGAGWPVAPTLTGLEPSPLEWAGAVRVRGKDAGAMAGVAGPVESVLLGCTPDALWVCVRFEKREIPKGELLVEVKGAHKARVLRLNLPAGPIEAAGEPAAAMKQTVMLRWPLGGAGLAAGDSAEVHLTLRGEGGTTQRLPAAGEALVEVPQEVERWRAAWT